MTKIIEWILRFVVIASLFGCLFVLFIKFVECFNIFSLMIVISESIRSLWLLFTESTSLSLPLWLCLGVYYLLFVSWESDRWWVRECDFSQTVSGNSALHGSEYSDLLSHHHSLISYSLRPTSLWRTPHHKRGDRDRWATSEHRR